MAKLLNRMLNLVGWETEDEEEELQDDIVEEKYQPPQYLQTFTKITEQQSSQYPFQQPVQGYYHAA